MLPALLQPMNDVGDLVRTSAGMSRSLLEMWPAPFRELLPFRSAIAAYRMVEDTKLTHVRPPFGIDSVMVDGRLESVHEVVEDRTPFGSLLHFAKRADLDQPKVLVVAPMSGHFATLLRPTVRTMLADHDVYITDWRNGRDIPLDEGRFDYDNYVAHLLRFLEKIGTRSHLMGVCQPCPAALIATSVAAQANSALQPLTLTLMAGPVDARINPTSVDEFAIANPLSYFETMLTTVSRRHAGAGRRVYPGALQITAFMAMNPERHVESHIKMLGLLARGDDPAAFHSLRDFYDEYFAVLDLPAEFYLDTVKLVFQEFCLARGTMTYEGRAVEPSAIRKTALLTIEGERDDICAVGQTEAAQTLCTSIPKSRRQHIVQHDVGHYGVFSGSRWQNLIYPQVRSFIANNS